MKKKLLDIVLPVMNESGYLAENVSKLLAFLKNFPYDYKIIIVESNSRDDTFKVAQRLAKLNKRIKAIHLDIPGRDFALKYAWEKSNAEILSYMDADLSSDLRSFPELVASIDEGYDIAVGSRLKSGAKSERSAIRTFLSNFYNKIIIPLALPTGVEDSQCGFKAISRNVSKNIIPKLGNNNGFLDSEMLAVAYSKGYKIKEIPVAWKETRDSNMSVWKNIPNFIKNITKTRTKILLGRY